MRRILILFLTDGLDRTAKEMELKGLLRPPLISSLAFSELQQVSGQYVQFSY